jgi:hypothetical protein
MNIWVAENAGNFWAGRGTVSMVLVGVDYVYVTAGSNQ